MPNIRIIQKFPTTTHHYQYTFATVLFKDIWALGCIDKSLFDSNRYQDKMQQGQIDTATKCNAKMQLRQNTSWTAQNCRCDKIQMSQIQIYNMQL